MGAGLTLSRSVCCKRWRGAQQPPVGNRQPTTGEPNAQAVAADRRAPAIFDADLQRERGTQATVKEAIAYGESVNDYVSRELLEHILQDTAEDIDFLETRSN